MELTERQFQRIADCLPRQRGNVSMTNLQLLNALLYMVEHGCKWRGLPKHLGNWHTIYTRMNRWSKAGVLDRVFARLQEEQILAIRIEHVCLDSTTIKVHPDGTGALKKRPPSHRTISGRMHHQDSSGCRGCSVCLDAEAFCRPSGGCPARTGIAGSRRPGATGLFFDHG
jgi:transposase